MNMNPEDERNMWLGIIAISIILCAGSLLAMACKMY